MKYRFIILAAIAVFALSGCVSSELKGSGIDRENQVIITDKDTVTIGITHAVLGKDTLKNLSFWWQSTRVVGSLESNAGFLGYMLDTNVFAGEAWTMTIWKDEPSLNAFVRSTAHKTAMQNGYSALILAEFMRATLPKEEVPQSLEEITAFVAEHRNKQNTDTHAYKKIRADRN